MSRPGRSISLGLAVSAGAIILTLLDAPTLLRVLFGLPVVVFLPGHALVALADSHGRLGVTERLAVAVGASLALTVVFGLLLAISPAGLAPSTWAVGLGGFSVAAHVAAVWNPPTARLERSISRRARTAFVRATAVVALTAGVALAIVAGPAAQKLGSEQAVERGDVAVMQLWATQAVGSDDLLVGISNPADSALECVLVTSQRPGEPVEQALTLEADSTRTLRVTAPEEGGALFPVTVELRAASDGSLLRRVLLWTDAVEGRAERGETPGG